MTLLQDIDNAKHIVIEFDVECLSSASALYTYVLRLHKKVSLLCPNKDLDTRFSFLPWFDKIKKSGYSSADLHVELKLSAIELYALFEQNNVLINQKMATALYSGLLIETDSFQKIDSNGMVFAMAKQLVEAKAEHKICTKYILCTKSLAHLRLKAILLKKMILQENATIALINIDDNDLKSSGANIQDAFEILKEALKLPHVNEAILKKNNKNLTKIKKEI